MAGRARIGIDVTGSLKEIINVSLFFLYYMATTPIRGSLLSCKPKGTYSSLLLTDLGNEKCDPCRHRKVGKENCYFDLPLQNFFFYPKMTYSYYYVWKYGFRTNRLVSEFSTTAPTALDIVLMPKSLIILHTFTGNEYRLVPRNNTRRKCVYSTLLFPKVAIFSSFQYRYLINLKDSEAGNV